MLKPYLKHVFEHKSLKKFLGGNLAFLVMAGSILPNSTAAIEAEASVIRQEETPLTTQKTVQYPLESYTITQGFSLIHPGIDLAASAGTEIKPVKNGKVAEISRSKYAYGNAVLIDHGDNFTSLYAHLSKIEVAEGDEITTLTLIGLVGTSGRATGPHLHLEIRKNDAPINPFVFLPSPASANR
jgi:murein DD-endopeptidase MepM/ murein hydrolase activator NlpD